MDDALRHFRFGRLHFMRGQAVRFINCEALRGDIYVFHGKGECFTYTTAGEHEEARQEHVIGVSRHGYKHVFQLVRFQILAYDLLTGGAVGVSFEAVDVGSAVEISLFVSPAEQELNMLDFLIFPTAAGKKERILI